MNTSRISIIIPTYNAAQYLPAALDSLLAQTRRPDEIIVVDDGSTDDTATVVAQYPVKYIRQANHRYPGATRNAGIRRATGEYIAFLDADDIAAPTRIEDQAQFLDEHPTAGAVMSNFANFNAGGRQSSQFADCPRIRALFRDVNEVLLAGELARDILLEENYALPSSMMIRRSVLNWVPGFTAETRIGEDLRFIYQVAQRFDIGLLDYHGCDRRIEHGGNVSGNSFNLLRDGVVLHELLARAEPVAHLAQKGLARAQDIRRSLARLYADRGEFRQAWTTTGHWKTNLRTLVLAARSAIGWRS